MTSHIEPEAKWSNDAHSLRSHKDDMKQQEAKAKTSAPKEELVEGPSSKVESEIHDVTTALRSHTQQTKEIQGPQPVDTEWHTVKGKAHHNKSKDVEVVKDKVEAAAAGWQATLTETGNSLLNAASNATASLRSRITKATPGIQAKVKRGVKNAREKLAAADFQDGVQEEEDEDEEVEDESSQAPADALDAAEANLGIVDSRSARVSKLHNLRRPKLKDSNMSWPLMFIGAIFTLWLAMSAIRYFSAPLEAISTMQGIKNSWTDTRDQVINSANDAQGRVQDRVQYHGQNLNILPPATWAGRTWAWITGAETYPQQAQRILRESYERATHEPTMSERIRSHLPGGHPETLSERFVRNLPDVDPRGTAQEYLERAQAAGYEWKEGMFRRIDGFVHPARPSLADRISTYFGGAEPTLKDQLQGGVQNLKNQVNQLGDNIQHRMADAKDASYYNRAAAEERIHSIGDRIKAHLPGSDNIIHQETLVEKMKHAVHDGVESIKSHLPGQAAPVAPTIMDRAELLRDDLSDRIQSASASIRDGAARVANDVLPSDSSIHNLRKEAEYVQHRAVHKAEELAHRLEEKYNEAKDHAQYHMPN